MDLANSGLRFIETDPEDAEALERKYKEIEA
jgi:hypothetical protein